MTLKRNNHGFTIVELMISTGVFATVLLLCVLAITQMGRMFYKGVSSAKAQEIARVVMDDISQAVQFGGGNLTNPAGENLAIGKDFWCVGTVRYSVNEGVKFDGSSGFGLARDIISDGICRDDSAAPNGKPLSSGSYEELLQRNMRVSKFDIAPVAGFGNVYRVSLKIAFGDDDLLEYDIVGGSPDIGTARCKGGNNTGSQFCATASLSTVLTRRGEAY